MIPDFPVWGLTASNDDPASFETNTVVLAVMTRISRAQLEEQAELDPQIAALLEGLD
ncbi:hypothetical protein SEA_RAHALELUJAH_41 [Mycobacterium phage Rahalelujah]|nr:hypothetical protein SEA_RAHALELUJAH_41 [Mycobacterium phage Rahalelujah]